MDDDAALVQRCLAGDAAAVRVFVERFQGLVFGLCWRMLRHREDAEDVTQEVFARAFRHLGHWDQSRSLRPWVLTIASNRCRTRLARRRTQPLAAGDWCDPATTNPATTDPAVTGLGEELQLGIDALRDDHKLCFELYYQQELSVQEIAAMLDCPAGTIKTWLHRARKQIADQLRERGVVTHDGYELHRS